MSPIVSSASQKRNQNICQVLLGSRFNINMSETDQSNLAEQLRQLGFSTDFTIPTHNNDSLIIYYKNIPVVSPFYKESFSKDYGMSWKGI